MVFFFAIVLVICIVGSRALKPAEPTPRRVPPRAMPDPTPAADLTALFEEYEQVRKWRDAEVARRDVWLEVQEMMERQNTSITHS
jgi:hypothetical protein